VHLVGFIIRIYHDTRSPERQKRYIHKHSMDKRRLLTGGYEVHVTKLRTGSTRRTEEDEESLSNG